MDEPMVKIADETSGHLSTESMSLALDELLDATEQQEFDAHLTTCEVCRAQWLKWRRISDVFRVEPFTAPAAGFMLRVDQAVQRDEKRRERLWGGLVLVGGTLSIWTVLLMGLALTLTVGATVFTGAQAEPLKILGISAEAAAVLVQSLMTIRDGLLAMLPGPTVSVGLAAVLAVLALIWLRLVRSSGRRSDVSGNGTSASTNNH